MSAEARVHENLVVTDHEHVRVLRIDREDKLGALSGSLVAALGAQIERIRTDSTVRAVVLTGTGRGFVAGADIGEYATSDSTSFAEYQRGSRIVFDALEALPQVTIAAVNGYAFGGGFELALCCDIMVAAERARFALPEVTLGLVPGGGGTVRLTRAVGTRWATELVVTGRAVTAGELHERGLLSAVHPGEELQEKALTLAAQIAALAPLAVREGKRLVREGVEREAAGARTEEQRALVALFDTQDAGEGIAAFIEKRPAQFTGA